MFVTMKTPGATRKNYMAVQFDPPADARNRGWDEKDHEGDLLILTERVKQILRAKQSASASSDTKPWMSVGSLLVELVHNKAVLWNLKENDVQTLLNGMTYQGVLQKRIEKEVIVFGLAPSPAADYSIMPCIACPVSRDCKDGSAINPKQCIYLTEWLGRQSTAW